MITLKSVPVKQDGFTVRAIDDETIFVNDRGDTLHSLNETGSFIWGRIDGKTALGELLELLRAEYEAASHDSEDDLFKFIGELAEKGIVRFEG
jgi:hypothetical protein